MKATGGIINSSNYGIQRTAEVLAEKLAQM